MKKIPVKLLSPKDIKLNFSSTEFTVFYHFENSNGGKQTLLNVHFREITSLYIEESENFLHFNITSF